MHPNEAKVPMSPFNLFLESVDCGLGTGTDRCVEVTLVQDRSWPDYGKVYYDNSHTLVRVAGAETYTRDYPDYFIVIYSGITPIWK